jgi:hypothetical protein
MGGGRSGGAATYAKYNGIPNTLMVLATKHCHSQQRAMQATPVKDGNGEAIGEFRYNGAVANKSLELLARILGEWSLNFRAN